MTPSSKSSPIEIDTSAHPKQYLRAMYGAPAGQRRPQIAAELAKRGYPQP